MAIDTAAKRFSMMDMGLEGYTPAVPLPDGTIDEGDRAHSLWLYSGLTGGGGTPAARALYIPTWRPRRR